MNTAAKWIRTAPDFGSMSPDFRKTIKLSKPLKKATAYVSAVGVYNLYVDGKKVGKGVLAPGMTSYYKRIQVGELDITNLLFDGSEVSIVCGKGWAVGAFGFHNTPNVYADRISVIADIQIDYADGTTEHICTDETWSVYTTHILDSEIYHGETKDFTKETKCVGKALLDDVNYNLIPQVGEDIIEQETVFPSKLIITPKGERVIDFGQNLAGYVEIKACGKRGDKIVVEHAEVLDADGNFYTENLRAAKNINTYILSGGEDVLKPDFCFQGYRYIRLTEYPFDEVDLSRFRSIAVYSDIKRTGNFVCGNEKLNQLYSNILWGQRSNFLDVPTDCPQRDERLGWTGDAQVFCRTAAINFDVERFFKKWLGDMLIDQGPSGEMWGIIPPVPGCNTRVSAAWGDAATVCPWEIYLAYGNKQMLSEHLPMMKRWVEYIHNFGDEEYLWIGGNHFGDWLAMDAGEGMLMGATQTDLIASAFFAYSTLLVIKACHALGEDAGKYEDMYANIKRAFHKAFIKDGLPVIYPKADAFSKDRPVKAVTQTAITLILKFKLYENEQERQTLINKLVELIEQNGNRMTTGFVGTPYILHALSENGRADVAYKLLLQEQNPSWLYSVNHGATTIWEHWDCQKEDGSFWSAEMNSFNHYAYGSVMDWLFGVMVGIKVCDGGAGYTHITVEPHPNREIGYAAASINSRQGKVSTSWRYNGNEIRYEILVPNGCTADVTLPNESRIILKSGNYTITRQEQQK